MSSRPFGFALLLLILYPFGLPAQTHSPFPVEIHLGPPPQPVSAEGKTYLLYELQLTSLSPRPINFIALDILGDNNSTPLATYRDVALEKLLVPLGPDPALGKTRTVEGGRTTLVFLNLALPNTDHVPAALHHRLTCSIPGSDGAPIEKTFSGPNMPVVNQPVPVLRAPLHGSGWMAANALSSTDHRRGWVPVDAHLYIAQRFAIDYIRLGSNGRAFHDDPKINANYYAYGAEVVAVADAQVVDVGDGRPEYHGSTERSARSISLDNAVGNYITLDLGHHHFALYAHLQPKSLKVKVGDHVHAGQVLALLGNSGNSDAPHLHFHLMDTNAPLASEGLPYEYETFTEAGIVADPDLLDAGQAWHPKPTDVPIVHTHEFPMNNAVLTFP